MLVVPKSAYLSCLHSTIKGGGSLIRKNIVFVSMIALLFLGCQNKIPEPNPTQVTEKNQKINSTIKLYGQELSIPKLLISKIYPDIVIDTKSIVEDVSLQGKIKNRQFIFDDKYAPYYIITLKKPLKIESLTILNTARYMPRTNKNSKNDLIALLVGAMPDTPKHPSLIHIASKNQEKLVPFVTTFTNEDKVLNVKKETIIFEEQPYTDELDVRISILDFTIGHSEYSSLFNDYTFVVKGYDPEYEYELIEWTFKYRENIDKNEMLIRNIAQDNQELYYKFKNNSAQLKLPKYSIVNLPKDVDMKYALTNTAEIYRTGRYKNKKGIYKSFQIAEISFNESDTTGNKQVVENIKITGKRIEKKSFSKTEEIPKEQNNYIDFSQGL